MGRSRRGELPLDTTLSELRQESSNHYPSTRQQEFLGDQQNMYGSGSQTSKYTSIPLFPGSTDNNGDGAKIVNSNLAKWRLEHLKTCRWTDMHTPLFWSPDGPLGPSIVVSVRRASAPLNRGSWSDERHR
uniref:Uncharacterized protein n=1 Tax=Trichuris muris TaxID=70415 RepID=A0A5S6Q1W2_TRIMR